MASPTLTFKRVTGITGATPSTTTPAIIDFGNVQVTKYSGVVAILATFAGKEGDAVFVNELKFWMDTVMATDPKGASVNVSNGSGSWAHTYHINSAWVNPSDIDNADTVSDNIRKGNAAITGLAAENTIPAFTAGTPPTPRFIAVPIVAPGGSTSNMKTATLVADSGYTVNTDYIYLSVYPDPATEDGVTTGWGYRISFQYS